MDNDEEKTIEETQPIAELDASRAPVRIALAVCVVAAVLFGWFAVRWQLANMLAELTPPTQPNARQVADFAYAMSPNDPLTNWFSASVVGDESTPETNANALKSFEQAVRLAPYDFHWWIDLGRAHEQAGNMQGAETALLQSVRLAPNYTLPHWQLGNFYLRQGKDAEAFAELKKAADNDVIYREQVFSIAWDYYEKDTKILEDLAGTESSVKASLAKFYAYKGRADDSIRVWNTLSDEEKPKYREYALLAAQSLFDKRFYRASVQFIRDLGIEPNSKAEAIENPGFEDASISENRPIVYFSWKILPTEKIEVRADPNQKHEGNRSLRMLFSGYNGIQLTNMYQFVVVQPSSRYRLNYWVRTENLKTAGTPTLEIFNAADDKTLAIGKPIPIGTNDWQQFQIEFAAPENAEAVMLRTSRIYCGNACPIFGTIWLDDFNLEKIK
jgi:tetratricopeptide (TPR) repeat protein